MRNKNKISALLIVCVLLFLSACNRIPVESQLSDIPESDSNDTIINSAIDDQAYSSSEEDITKDDSILSGSAVFAADEICSESSNGIVSLSGLNESEVLYSYSLAIENLEYQGDIAYRSFVQDTGWQAWKPSNEISGTDGIAICGIQIMLIGHISNYYDVSYRVKLQSSGWQEWVYNGTVSGMTEEPIVGMEVKLEAKQGDIKDATWTLTEYGDDDGRQSEFYTLKNNDDGTLIVIDGGWDANTEQVRSIINVLGGKVDFWFITHYDADHVSAFNNIYADLQGITIGTIYATPLDYDLYCIYAAERWWDTPEVYKLFLDQTEGDDSVVYLNRGDSISIDGLSIDVYNSYDQIIVDTGNPDVANYGSLMFKITGNEDSFLVCGDVYGDELGDILLDMYGEEMKANIVQPGHHGNGSMSSYFYEAINPEIMFFDGPAWLMESDEYTAKSLMEWCESQDIQTYTYDTAPNSMPFE